MANIVWNDNPADDERDEAFDEMIGDGRHFEQLINCAALSGNADFLKKVAIACCAALYGDLFDARFELEKAQEGSKLKVIA